MWEEPPNERVAGLVVRHSLSLMSEKRECKKWDDGGGLEVEDVRGKEAAKEATRLLNDRKGGQQRLRGVDSMCGQRKALTQVGG